MKKKKLVFLTGAGMSVESGLKTFRNYDGLWEEYPVSQVATHEGWELGSDQVTKFYNMLRLKYKDVKPCEGHKIIAGLEEQFDVEVITQNVDNLHEAAGTSNVIHLHGEIMKVCSETPEGYCGDYIVDLDPQNPVVEPGTLAPDGTLLRPYIVFFGEPAFKVEEAIDIIREADIFVIIGTSLSVYPAARLIRFVPETSPIYVIDPGTPDSEILDTMEHVKYIKKGASEGMKELCNILNKEAIAVDGAQTTEKDNINNIS